jgi:hypothetical protein
MPHIASAHGIRLTEYMHTEPSDGKSELDRGFGVAGHMARGEFEVHTDRP